jgi:cell division septation protein DedD
MNEALPEGILYSVQVASSPNREDSERLVRKFGERGHQAYIMTADLGQKGIWYRVRVGNLATREDAEFLKNELLAKTPKLINSPYVIKVSE